MARLSRLDSHFFLDGAHPESDVEFGGLLDQDYDPLPG
jgi:hypothetical protein